MKSRARDVLLSGCLALGTLDLAYINVRVGPALAPAHGLVAHAPAHGALVRAPAPFSAALSAEPGTDPPLRETALAGFDEGNDEAKGRGPDSLVLRFATDDVRLDAAAERELDALVARVRRGDEVSVTIEGHADARGSAEYNAALSARRATAVAAALRRRGLAASMIHTRAYGESRPRRADPSSDAWAENRRVEVRIEEPRR